MGPFSRVWPGFIFVGNFLRGASVSGTVMKVRAGGPSAQRAICRGGRLWFLPLRPKLNKVWGENVA